MASLLFYVLFAAIVAGRCTRKAVEGHEIALVVTLSTIVAISIRQLVSFFRPDSPFRDPALRRALPSIVTVRAAGCLLLIDSVFNLIPTLSKEYSPKVNFFEPMYFLHESSILWA